MKQYAYLVSLVCALALAAALIIGYYSAPACPLCIYARWIFGGLGIVSFLYARAEKPRFARKRVKALYVFCLLFCLLGGGLSILHSGVERGWIHLNMACTQDISTQGAPLSVDQLRKKLSAKAPARCDRIELSILGLSLANYNILLFALLFLGFVIYGRRKRK